MTPHLMSSIRNSQGALVRSYTPTPMPRSASAQAAQAVTALMESVPKPGGTAAGVGFPSYLCAAVKTGTAQTGLGLNHDWMIGFAPANDPQIAVAVVVPFQNIASDGASVAGPIMNKVMQAALPPGSVSQPCTVRRCRRRRSRRPRLNCPPIPGPSPSGWKTSIRSCYAGPMSKVIVSAERAIDAPAETVYGYLANLEEHRRFLPPAFSDFEVEGGGVGAGSVVRFKVSAGGRERAYRMTVAEPEPGRVITESDSNSSLVTTFTVTPQGPTSRVHILTSWDGAGGVGGSSNASSLPGPCRRSISTSSHA